LKIGLPEAKKRLAGLVAPRLYRTGGSHRKMENHKSKAIWYLGLSRRDSLAQSVENALAALRDRIKAINEDDRAAYSITDAVAFRGFLRIERGSKLRISELHFSGKPADNGDRELGRCPG